MIKVGFKKIAALLLTLVLILPMVPFAASAAEGSADPALIDTGRKGSITVTKYASANANAAKGDATGTVSDKNSVANGYTPLNGATFKLFKIADVAKVVEYYNGTSTTTYSLNQFTYQDDGTATYGSTAITEIWEGTTTGEGENAGKYTFSNLPVGIYVLKEVTAPNQIAAPLAEDSLISIPMVNTASSSNNGNAEWMYNVFVYPKNHASTGTVELTKVDQNGTALQNVGFKLYKKEFDKDGNLSTDWAEVTTTIDNAGTSTTLELKTNSNGQLTVANLPSGLYGTQYKLVEVSAPNGYIVNQTPLYFKVNKDNTMSWNAATGEKGDCNNANTGVVGTPTVTEGHKLSITLRNELPSLTKQVKENGGDAWKTDEQYRLDDEITYRLTVYVPNNVAELGTFEIKDVPQAGITDSGDSGDYTVKYGNTNDSCTTSLTGDKYSWSTINATGTNGQGFMLTLTDATAAGKFIQIVYKAHMNANAVIAGNGNGNTATLTYSKSIGGGNENYTITDEARVYTYQFQITKYKDSVKTGNEIGNVQFKLLDSQKSATTQEHVLNVVKVEDGVYRLALAGETTGTTDTLTTKSDGTILIKGLENGTYYLKETKTIKGYNLLSAPFAIQVNVTEKTTWTSGGGFTENGKIVKNYDSTTYNVDEAMGTSTIINKKGFVLPQTGGMGYLLFCTVGIVLIAGGAALIFGGRKKKIR